MSPDSACAASPNFLAALRQTAPPPRALPSAANDESPAQSFPASPQSTPVYSRNAHAGRAESPATLLAPHSIPTADKSALQYPAPDVTHSPPLRKFFLRASAPPHLQTAQCSVDSPRTSSPASAQM